MDLPRGSLLFYENCDKNYAPDADPTRRPDIRPACNHRDCNVFYPTLEDLVRGHLYRARVDLGPWGFEEGIFAVTTASAIRLVDLSHASVAREASYIRLDDSALLKDESDELLKKEKADGLIVRGNGLSSCWIQIEVPVAMTEFYYASIPISAASPGVVGVLREFDCEDLVTQTG